MNNRHLQIQIHVLPMVVNGLGKPVTQDLLYFRFNFKRSFPGNFCAFDRINRRATLYQTDISAALGNQKIQVMGIKHPYRHIRQLRLQIQCQWNVFLGNDDDSAIHATNSNVIRTLFAKKTFFNNQRLVYIHRTFCDGIYVFEPTQDTLW